MSWLRSFSLAGIDGSRVLIAVKPGHRDLAKFVTESKKAQLAALVQAMTGQRVTIELVKADAATDDAEPADAAPQRPGRVTTEQRRAALDLPLVKAVSDLFEIQLIDVRKEYNDGGDTTEQAQAESEGDDV